MNVPGSEGGDAYCFAVSARGLLRGLWWVVAVLLGLHVLLTVIHYTLTELPWLLRQIFDVDEEDSIPTWYSAAALLVTAGVVALWARERRADRDSLAWHWWGLAFGFAGLSLDEVAGLHETLNSLIPISWTIPGAIVAALLAGIYLQFLVGLPRRLALTFVLAGLMYLGGALGVEAATDRYAEQDALDTLAYNLWTPVEEGLEMGGVLVFLGGMLRLMQRDGRVAVAVRVTH